MKKLLPLIIWAVLLIACFALNIPRNEAIYFQSTVTLIILFVMGYHSGVKKWRILPEKTVEARFLKERYGHDKSYPDRPVSVATYAYELAGKTHRIKLQKMNPSFPDTATLYYRKGKSDIHLKGHDDIPVYYRLLWTLLICPGSAVIVFIVLHVLLKLPIDF